MPQPLSSDRWRLSWQDWPGYLDDILGFGHTLQEHNTNLTQVLGRLHRAGHAKKYRFTLEKVEYLGHVVSAEEVRTDPKKVTAVQQFPTPVNVKALQSFLGLASCAKLCHDGWATACTD